MTMTAKQTRPGRESEARANRLTTYPESYASTADSSRTDCLALAELDALAERVRGCFVVVVAKPSATDPGRIVRRPYLTAAAAERAARRATERGQTATVYLAELRPVHRIVGGAR